MNRSFLLSLAVGSTLLLGNFANAQTVATDPVGFTSTTVTQNTTKALSLPFNKVPDYAAAVSAVTSTTIQTTGATFGANAFAPFATNPHLVRMVDGNGKGRQFRITSHTADTLTLATDPVAGGVQVGNKYQIFASETLGTLFGTTSPPGVITNGNSALADNVLLRIGATWITYYNDGTQWLRQGPGTASNNVAVTPEQGFLYVRRAGSDYNFTALGAVPITNQIYDIPQNSTVSLGNRFPVATTLTGLSLDSNPAWNKNANASLADNVLIRIGATWITYYYDTTQGGPTNGNPGSWIRQGPGTINQNPPIAIGNSVIVVRRGGGTLVLDQPLPYTLP